MCRMKKIVINDTNILIDLFNSGLMKHCKHLPLEMHTVDLVKEEVKEPDQQEALRLLEEEGTLIVVSQPPEDSEQIFQLFVKNTTKFNLSIPDYAVIVYAQRHKCTILTGDRKMRSFAESQGLEVSGIFYLIDLFVEEKIINQEEMANHLRLLAASNVRLPKFAIDERIKKYTTQTEE